ncbi:MAG TPA: GNAT family N-acetyltransferase, partial [Nevskiaceae bacterium]|nr:GNAT family N-acetyltransferase [Nevskiaceae bacterium]
RPTELRTARLRLLPLAADDVDALHRLWTAPGVRKYLWDDRVLRFEQTRDLVMQSGYLYEQRGYGLWGAFDAGGVLVGFCGFWFFRNDHELELLYGVDEGEWLRGYAREMAQAMVGYGFEVLGLTEIRASTDAPNVASQRVLKRLGFVADFERNAPGSKTVYFRLPRGRRDGAPLPVDAF